MGKLLNSSWQIHWEESDEGRARVRLEGRLDKNTVPEVRKDLLKTLKSGRFSEIVVDLSGVERMDTAGVALLVEMHNQAINRGVRWKIERTSSTAHKMLVLSRLSVLMEERAETP